MIGAPVYQRASLIASSAASAPVVPNTTRLRRSPGASAASLVARRSLGSPGRSK